MNFKFLVPETMLVKKESYLESDMYLFGHQSSTRVELMSNTGEVSSDLPSDEMLLGSKEFSERAWVSGSTLGHEMRGVLADGKHWRRISFRAGIVEYRTDSRAAIEVFDYMIDNACFEELIREQDF